MALMQVEFYSETLGFACEANVILPQKEQGIGVTGSASAEKYPVLWLLHGASDDHTIWLRRTSIERYVANLGLAVVMPNAHLSSYSNMAHGPQYFDFLTEELPRVMGEFFPLSDKREDNFVCGLSMGGYGAMKLGLCCPDKYAAIGCFSAGNFVLRPKGKQPKIARPSGGFSRNMAVFGTDDMSELQGNPEFDHFAMVEKARAEGKPLPRIFHACGTDDFLLENARQTAEWFKAQPDLEYEYHEGPGIHSWAFWDTWIQHYLTWLRQAR